MFSARAEAGELTETFPVPAAEAEVADPAEVEVGRTKEQTESEAQDG